MQGLKWVHQNAGNITSRRKHFQRGFVHVFQRVSVLRCDRIANTGLHVAPPAVVRATKSDEMGALRVILCKTHRLHDRLGAGHMKRDFVQPGDRLQPCHILGHHWMIGTEHGPQRLYLCSAPFDAALVEVVAEYVHAIRTGQIEELIAVEICYQHAFRLVNEHASLEMGTNISAELKRNAIVRCELHIGDAIRDLRRHSCAFDKARLVQRAQLRESRAADRSHVVGCVIRSEKIGVVVLVVRHPLRNLSRHLRVSRQRAMLGQRQLNAGLEFRQCRDWKHSCQCGECHQSVHQKFSSYYYPDV